MIRILFILSILVTFATHVTISQIHLIPFNDLETKCDFKSDSNKFVLNSKIDLMKISGCNLLDFDFGEYTIIGVKGAIEGANEDLWIDFKISKDDKKNKYIITATIFGQGSSRMMQPFKRIIYTDKLQSNYDIEFKVFYK